MVSVLKKACGARLPSGSLTSTQRTGLGGVPGRYHKAVSEVISSVLFSLRPYQEDTVILRQGVAGFESSVFNFGSGAPFCAGRPTVRASRLGGGAKRLASSRSRLMRVARPSMAWANSWTAKLLSPTKTMSRPGNQRQSWSAPWRAQSVSSLCLRPRWWSERSDGASRVKTGRAFTKPAQGTGVSTMKLSQRKPLALTK